MEKKEKRSINNYLHVRGQSVQKIHLDVKEVLENDAPSQATVYRWTAAFTACSAVDEHRSGRPSDLYI